MTVAQRGFMLFVEIFAFVEKCDVEHLRMRRKHFKLTVSVSHPCTTQAAEFAEHVRKKYTEFGGQ